MKWIAGAILLAGIYVLLRGFLRFNDNDGSEVNRHHSIDSHNIG